MVEGEFWFCTPARHILVRRGRLPTLIKEVRSAVTWRNPPPKIRYGQAQAEVMGPNLVISLLLMRADASSPTSIGKSDDTPKLGLGIELYGQHGLIVI